MNAQDNLNNASTLANSVALLLAQPGSSSGKVSTAVDGLINALANKARGLIEDTEIKVSIQTHDRSELIMGAGDTARIHSNGNVEVRSGNYNGPDCDCAHAPCLHTPQCAPEFPKTMTGPIGFVSEALTDYLRSEFSEGKIDHVVRVVSDGRGRAEFYIRPMNADGQTVQFVACPI